jgi:hypothetical protein
MNQSSVVSLYKMVHVTGKQLGADLQFVFTNEASANTQKTKTIDKPIGAGKNYKFLVHNPSTVTDLTLKFFDVEASLGAGETTDCYITSVIIPKAQTITGTEISAYSVIIEGCFTSDTIKIAASNNTVLGATEGFTATVRVREV